MQTSRFVRILAGAMLAMVVASPSAYASTRFGLEGGINAGQLGNTIMGDGHYWKLGGGLTALSEIRVAPDLTLEAAPGWERQVRRATFNIVTYSDGAFTGAYPIDHSIHFDRLVLPIRASWRPPERRWSVEAGVGPAWIARAERRNESEAIYAAPALAASRGREVTPDAAIFEGIGTFDRFDWTSNFHRWDAVVSGGLGWDAPVGAATLRVRTRWQHGLVDLSKEGEPLRLSSGSFAFGLLW